ncbi:hypothetical protein GCM10010124_13190 [Pilimelia terevasa]|uniref:DUF4360 domain-containing protein n=1 Tax=Pilimelia terevasa TaxID=53372 RepID=A0A8J3BKX1_9ACTN|nr:DUF4360 domain-containing protein [Pilimelia terevasa]GGK22064.1 hypothetical protein GCM10010124_13190 [Pilimelia terevasa]
MKKTFIGGALAAALLGTAALPASSAAASPADELGVSLKRNFGSGCAETDGNKTPLPAITDDKKGISIKYAGFFAVTPVPAGQRSVSCNVILEVTYPQGKTFIVKDSRWIGYVATHARAKAELNATYYFGPDQPLGIYLKRFGSSLPGQSWNGSQVATELTPAPCGSRSTTVTLRTTLTVDPGAQPTEDKAMLSLNYAEHKASSELGIEMRNC